MATYDQFITAATGAGLLDRFDDDDLNIARNNPEYGMSALRLRQQLQGAKTTEQKMLAQESLNQLKKSYGGSVQAGTPALTTSGSGTASSVAAPAQPSEPAGSGAAQSQPAPGGSFNYGNETAYQKLLNEVTNPGSFSYDHNSDPTFQSMKKSYLREGERAREDTMGKYAAMTGGVPSSAAITAAQQAGDYYAAQLNDSIPTLEQNAYQRFLAELDAKSAALGAVTADRNFDWQKHLAEYDQQQSQIQQEEAAKQQAWANAFALYKELGYATPEIAEILGIEANVPQTGGQNYSPAPQPKPTVDVSADYLALKKSGATAMELDNFLKSAIAAGYIDQRTATELRQMKY